MTPAGILQVRVDLGPRSYPILIGAGCRFQLADLVRYRSRTPQLVVIADQNVANTHGAALAAALPTPPLFLPFTPGETTKSLAECQRLYDALAAARIERQAILLTFGGGVAGDLGGFVAATWLRGVAYIQLPTTLLAAIDASVGGKTGLNLAAGKNLVGAFHQPLAVVVDLDFLTTLPTRTYTAGLAESMKHALIRAPNLLAWHEQNADAIAARVPEVLGELIARNCAIKAAVVAADEREADLRAILNYGHTIGHALEHLLEYELQHGECVALGMLVENEIARRRGLLDAALAERVRTLMARLGLPVRLPRPVAAAAVQEVCAVDKKVAEGAVTFVLLRGVGEPVKVRDVAPGEIAAALEVIAPA